ncbi:ABC transporter permease [Spiroplasma corruscae]|uniref:ABC transporter permease n=1 Tax=Spiroplasma corruscae TaxID=216934 RepID=A0A222EQ21_9MOLU|nr:hypothetical protein [Spiroplasma corruscae]ASP28552.1 ABC transporter permease [Spiroplasma corruscae]
MKKNFENKWKVVNNNKGNISIIRFIKFIFLNLCFDKTFIYFNISTFFFSFIFALYSSFLTSNSDISILFDFYTLFFIGVIMFLQVIRVCYYLFIRKSEDKTLFIIVSNTMSRLKFFITIFFVNLILILFQVLFSFIIFNLFNILINHNNLSDNIILQKTSTFIWFASTILTILCDFVVFLFIIVKSQAAMTILTLLLAFTFVANLPLRYLKTSEEVKTLSFDGGQEYNVPQVYEAFDLQNRINKGNIKYKYLSSYINNFYLNNNGLLYDDDFTTDPLKSSRLNLWEELGVIVDKNDPNSYGQFNYAFNNLKLKNTNNSEIPYAWRSDANSSEPINRYSIQLVINKRYINQNELLSLYNNAKDNTKALIIKDIYDFSNQIISSIVNYQKSLYLLYQNFSLIDLNNSFIVPKSSSGYSDKINLKEEYWNSTYNYNFYPNGTKINDVVFYDSEEDGSLKQFINEVLSNPVFFATRLVEKYFLSDTNTYKNILEKKLLKNNENYTKYISSRNFFNWFSMISPFYSLWSSYTYFSGNSANDIWFSLTNYDIPSIVFDAQDNIFLPYVQYTLQTDTSDFLYKNNYDKFIKPDLFIYLYLIVTFILLYIAYYKFRRIDI